MNARFARCTSGARRGKSLITSVGSGRAAGSAGEEAGVTGSDSPGLLVGGCGAGARGWRWQDDGAATATARSRECAGEVANCGKKRMRGRHAAAAVAWAGERAEREERRQRNGGG
uniref:Uncharacterized protein n=1 Tax=Oryza glumipatula TaxID=40148 RepID=A0A0D9YF28_9ORYZ